MVSPSINYKKLFLFGFYSLSYGKDDNEGLPANPYNLRAEWGPSSYADVRHRFVMGTSIPLPFQVSISPFIVLQSGTPYNITTGLDPNHDGIFTARPNRSPAPRPPVAAVRTWFTRRRSAAST